MTSRASWWWILVLLLLLLAPGPAGRLLLDLLGGVTLLVLLTPLLLGGVGWLAWFLLQRRLRTCPACGFRSLGAEVCPACGTVFAVEVTDSRPGSTQVENPNFDARDVTIDVTVTDIDSEA